MTATLTQVSHEHHERLIGHIDTLPEVGDMIGHVPVAELRPRVIEVVDFLEGLLLPHMEASERALYPELERMMQNRHSMATMRREHEEIRQLVAALTAMRPKLADGCHHTGDCVALRRIIFRLYAMLKTHLAEEELYLAIVERGGVRGGCGEAGGGDGSRGHDGLLADVHASPLAARPRPAAATGQCRLARPSVAPPRASMLSTHMDVSSKGVADRATTTPGDLASDRDEAGVPVHRGWAPAAGRHRWMEPFVLVLLADGGAHGYAITAQLEEMGITGGPVDIGQVYRTLRDLEAAAMVTSAWSADPVGPQRRDYELTEAGYAAIDAWAAVMRERARLIGEFNARYLESVVSPRGSS